jgi:putative two-component system response regulator
LVNERCYKDAFSPEEAFRMIVNGECGVFSPRLMEVFRMARLQFEKIAAAK